jgi:hypothetical protein
MSAVVAVPGGLRAAGASRAVVPPRKVASERELGPDDAAQILRGWQRNARTALHWLHPDWLIVALGIVHGTDTGLSEALATLRAQADEACSLAALRVLLPVPPTLEAFSAAPAARLDALPIETGLRVLRMQALLARRAEVRRLVDRTTRKRLAQWIGCPLDDLLGKAVPEAPSLADAKRERDGSRALASLDPDELALEGLTLLPRLRTSHLPVHQTRTAAACPLLRLALPRANWADGIDEDEGECEAAFALLHERIGPLLPEYAWLSG